MAPDLRVEVVLDMLGLGMVVNLTMGVGDDGRGRFEGCGRVVQVGGGNGSRSWSAIRLGPGTRYLSGEGRERGPRPSSRDGMSLRARTDGRFVRRYAERSGVGVVGGQIFGQRRRFQHCRPRARTIPGGLCRNRRRHGGRGRASLDFDDGQVSTTVNHQTMSIETGNPL